MQYQYTCLSLNRLSVSLNLWIAPFCSRELWICRSSVFLSRNQANRIPSHARERSPPGPARERWHLPPPLQTRRTGPCSVLPTHITPPDGSLNRTHIHSSATTVSTSLVSHHRQPASTSTSRRPPHHYRRHQLPAHRWCTPRIILRRSVVSPEASATCHRLTHLRLQPRHHHHHHHLHRRRSRRR